MSRRQFSLALTALGASGVTYSTINYWPESGFINACLAGLPDELKNHPLMQRIWDGIDPTQSWDSHAHVIGAGDSGSGAWFNPNMTSWMHPMLKVQRDFYINGGCIQEGNADASFIERICYLASEMPMGYKTMLFAFDYVYSEQGVADKAHSIFHIPDTYAMQIAKQYPQYFEWVASIHPYRKDAIDALEFAKANGARAIKWLPSGMGINPSSPLCDKFYQKLNTLNLPIISHTGRESAVQGGDQSLGNPLYLRRALDAGVRVVLAHCASDGLDKDLDNGGKSIASFELFSRLMDDQNYKDVVFGEISAITLLNHAWVIKPLLAHQDWHSRLLNGTDYPLPALLPLVSTNHLQRQGLLEESYLSFLQALRNYNPLMFDFAVKRLIRHDGIGFADNIFETKRFFLST